MPKIPLIQMNRECILMFNNIDFRENNSKDE